MSTAKFNQWLNPDGTENYKCRAWVNFNGTGTVAIRAAGNVSSITDNGTGDYTVNFTTAMPDVDYTVIATAQALSAPYTVTVKGAAAGPSALTTATVPIVIRASDATASDSALVNVVVFR